MLTIIVLLFIAATVTAGFWRRGKQTSVAGYLIAGGTVGLPLFVMSNVATWYGGILGVGEFTYNYGVDNWLAQCLPYYFFALLLAIFFVKKIRSTSFLSIPEVIREKYGATAGILSAAALFLLSSPAPYLLMTAQILTYFFNLPLAVTLVITAFLTVSYVMYGGFRSDLNTDVFFFVIMFAGFSLALFALFRTYGGVGFLSSNLPPSHLQLMGNIPFSYLVVWWIIAVWTFADPGFYQRIKSARSNRVAVTGIALSVVLWFAFDFLTNSIGLYARALHPALANPAISFLILADTTFSPVLKGIFIISMLATILSTLNSIFLLSGMTFARDIAWRFRRFRVADESQEVRFIRLGILVSAIISIFIGLLLPSAVKIWYTLGSVFIPGVLCIFVSSYYQRLLVSKNFAVVEIFISLGAGVMLWAGREFFHFSGAVFSLEPMFVSLTAAIVIHGAGMTKKGLRKTEEIGRK